MVETGSVSLNVKDLKLKQKIIYFDLVRIQTQGLGERSGKLKSLNRQGYMYNYSLFPSLCIFKLMCGSTNVWIMSF